MVTIALYLLMSVVSNNAFSKRSPVTHQLGFLKIEKWSELGIPHRERPYGLNREVRKDEDGGKVESDKAGVVATIAWPLPKESPYPELNTELPVGKWLSGRDDLGIALSGGGLRAATCTLGWLRALNELGYLKRARYVSCNSGATWVTFPLSALDLIRKKEATEKHPLGIDIDLETFLGKYIEPEKIGEEDIKSELGVIGNILADSNVMDLIGDKKTYDKTSLADLSSRFNEWCEAIDRSFVQTLFQTEVHLPDLYKDMGDAYLWTDSDTRLNEHRFPFTIYQATAYASGDDKNRVAGPYFQYEFTPLYTGAPVDPRNLYTKAEKTFVQSILDYFNLGNPEFEYKVGGGFTQSIAFNSHVSEAVDAVPETSHSTVVVKQLPLPPKVLKIGEITGISSSFVGALLATLSAALGDFAKLALNALASKYGDLTNPTIYHYWSPSTGGTSQKLGFSDGGLLDNTGIIGLVRRGVKKIIACIASDADVIQTFREVDGKRQPTHDDKEKLKSIYGDLSALFGVRPNSAISSEYKETFNDLQQIFDPEDWVKLVDSLIDKRKNGLPHVVNFPNLRVRANEKAGVYNSYEVDITFCINGRDDTWASKLPEGDAKAFITKPVKKWASPPPLDSGNPLPLVPNLISNEVTTLQSLGTRFPYVSTFSLNYDKTLTNYLAHLSSYTLKKGLEIINESRQENK